MSDRKTIAELIEIIDNCGSIPLPNDSSYSMQWYGKNTALLHAEIRAMQMIHPTAEMGILPDGRMYWFICLSIEVCGTTKDWVLIAVYDEDHPSNNLSSIKFYPAKPSIDEMKQMINQSPAVTQIYSDVPHTIRDDSGIVHLSYENSEMRDAHMKGRILTAAYGIRRVKRWISMFEAGLLTSDAWEQFSKGKSRVPF